MAAPAPVGGNTPGAPAQHRPQEPYPIEVNRDAGGIAVLVTDSTTSSNILTYNSLKAAIISQYPLINLGDDGTYAYIKKIEVWGIQGGGVSLNVHNLPAPFIVNTNMPPRKTFIDFGTVSSRPYCSYEWPEAMNEYNMQNIGADSISNVKFATVGFTAGGTATVLGTGGIVYMHFGVRSPIVLVTPAEFNMNIIMENSKEKRNILLAKRLREEDQVHKIAKIQALKPPSDR